MSEPVETDGAPQPGAAEPTDEQLLERVAAGDPAALTELYGRYKSLAYGLAVRIMNNGPAAEDVVQEAFLGVWRNASRYVSAKASARTWVLAIVHHRAIDAIRRRRPTAELPEGDSLPTTLVVPDVWREVSGRLDRSAIANALGSLPGVQREAIELAYFSGLTQQEIAARTDTPLGTVKSRVRLGLLALRRALLEPGGAGVELLASAGPDRPGSVRDEAGATG